MRNLVIAMLAVVIETFLFSIGNRWQMQCEYIILRCVHYASCDWCHFYWDWTSDYFYYSLRNVDVVHRKSFLILGDAKYSETNIYSLKLHHCSTLRETVIFRRVDVAMCHSHWKKCSCVWIKFNKEGLRSNQSTAFAVLCVFVFSLISKRKCVFTSWHHLRCSALKLKFPILTEVLIDTHLRVAVSFMYALLDIFNLVFLGTDTGLWFG